MSLHAFDTLRFAERLEKAGLTREQAAEFSKALGDFMQEKLVTKEDLRNLATKEDLHQLKSELKEDLHQLKSELKENSQKFATKDDMRWLFGATIAILTLVMTAFKLFH